MASKYEAWIKQKYPTFEDALGKCVEAVKAMAKDFPELRITNGFAHFLNCELRAHWWLVDSEGSIVDPTKHQYPEYLGSPIIEYEEIDAMKPVSDGYDYAPDEDSVKAYDAARGAG